MISAHELNLKTSGRSNYEHLTSISRNIDTVHFGCKFKPLLCGFRHPREVGSLDDARVGSTSESSFVSNPQRFMNLTEATCDIYIYIYDIYDICMTYV